MFFAKLAGGAIGGQYDVMVNRAADGAFETVSRATLKYAGTRCDDTDLVAKWET